MIKIRKGRPEDRNIIVDFQLKMALETEDLKIDKKTVTKGVQAVFDDPGLGEYMIAEEHEKIVGSLLLITEWSDWRNGSVLWIHSVYIRPETRRQGIFRQMYDHVRERVEKDPGLMGLRLYVDDTNLPAQKVYEAVGMDGDHYRLYEWMKK